MVLLAGRGRRRDGERGGWRAKGKRVIGEGGIEGEMRCLRERERSREIKEQQVDGQGREGGGKGRAMDEQTGCECNLWTEPHQADRQWMEELVRWRNAKAFPFTHPQHKLTKQTIRNQYGKEI